MKRTLLVISILSAILITKIDVWAQGEIISSFGIINMPQINNFQEQRYIGMKLPELFELIDYQLWIRNKVTDIFLLNNIPMPKISDSIEREVDLLSKYKYVDKFL